jgi:hypothetical protein
MKLEATWMSRRQHPLQSGPAEGQVRGPGTLFVRVVHREGWDVELVEEGLVCNFATREQALACATEQEPAWIEVGEVSMMSADEAGAHIWTTLQREQDGGYRESGLSWGGRGD